MEASRKRRAGGEYRDSYGHAKRADSVWHIQCLLAPMFGSGKLVARFTPETNTLFVDSRGEDMIDQVVVLCVIHRVSGWGSIVVRNVWLIGARHTVPSPTRRILRRRGQAGGRQLTPTPIFDTQHECCTVVLSNRQSRVCRSITSTTSVVFGLPRGEN